VKAAGARAEKLTVGMRQVVVKVRQMAAKPMKRPSLLPLTFETQRLIQPEVAQREVEVRRVFPHWEPAV
jgi:hypothetical protein